jgi:ankyrin repeat protein|eukprot:Stramenopile-MAST_4_protein_3927
MADAAPDVEKGMEEPKIRVIETGLKELPDVLDSCVYIHEQWPIVYDVEDCATRFFKYQPGNFLYAQNPVDVTKENLRKCLVGSLKFGTWLILHLGSTKLEVEQFFDPKHFPKELLSGKPMHCNTPEFFGPLLRVEQGDDPVDEFVIRDGFKFIVVTTNTDESDNANTSAAMINVKMLPPKGKRGAKASKKDFDNELMGACGVKETFRNSKKLVEAAFEGDMKEVQEYLNQGYSIESFDAHNHTAISEAAAKGHMDLVEFLIDQGGDPNTQNDQGRTALYRACFHRHKEMVELLLQCGADPRLKAGDECPVDVAKDDDIKTILSDWDMKITDQLIEDRRKKIEREIESRVTNAVERETLARDRIRLELVKYISDGNLKAYRERMDDLLMEAITNRERIRGTAMARDDRGNTLLMIAVTKGYKEIVEFLLTHYKTLDPEFDKDERKAHFVGVNAKDQKGWNACQIAAFHRRKDLLQIILEHGGDPIAKNAYNKSAFDFGKDELDAAEAVLVDRSEIRQVLNQWEEDRIARLKEKGIDVTERNVARAKDPTPPPSPKKDEKPAAKKGGGKKGDGKKSGATGKSVPKGATAKGVASKAKAGAKPSAAPAKKGGAKSKYVVQAKVGVKGKTKKG